MTTSPGDLDLFRRQKVMPLTGLSGNDVGISPDEEHLKGGGYHVGEQDIQQIGRWLKDYSTRQGRDRNSPKSNWACAMDIGDDWPNGGRAAWLRFNNLLVARMRASDPELVALRAVNFSPDGTARKRYDSLHPEDGIINSTDSVYMHTHLEWWRDTVNSALRARSLVRIGQLIELAINNKPFPAGEDDEDMGQTLTGVVPAYTEYTDAQGKSKARGYTIAPGLIEAGLANPRPGWLNLIGDGYGEKFAIRLLVTDGVKDANGNVNWTSVFKDPKDTANYGRTEFQFGSGERFNVSLPKGTTAITIGWRAIDSLGHVVPVDLPSGLRPNPHTLAWSIELGAIIK